MAHPEINFFFFNNGNELFDLELSNFRKRIVSILNKQNLPEANFHNKGFRPWGNYTSLAEGKNWQVKKIIVKPNESLSLQLHNKRTEHWIVVKGTAEVEIDNNVKILSENESTYIPLGSKHRLVNPGKIPLEIIEVQSLGEVEALGRRQIEGKIVFYNRPTDQRQIQTGAAYGGAVDQRSAGPSMAAKYGAVGVVIRSVGTGFDDVPHTGVTSYKDSIPKIPAAAN